MRSASEKAAAVSAVRNAVKQMEAASRHQKDFETKHSCVFAAPDLPLAQFNCEIRDKRMNRRLRKET
jgi:hypothetical protein